MLTTDGAMERVDTPTPRRRELIASLPLAAGWGLGASAAAVAGASVAADIPAARVIGSEHSARKTVDASSVRLFLWRKQREDVASGQTPAKSTVVLVHGSSVSSTPSFDLQVPGRTDSSVMDWLARRGHDVWCFDCEGYGRSDKSRPVNADIACGADDLAAVTDYILQRNSNQPVMLYGASSGALRAGLFAQRHPQRVRRLALDALVWTGQGSPTLAERKKRVAQYQANLRRPIDRDMIRSIFTRDHPGTTDQSVAEVFADAVLALDDSMPTGTYLDMSIHLPVIDPARIQVPVLIMRGQYDGIASFADLAAFFERLPNPDKQFVVMPGIAHTSTRSKNYALVYHLLDSYFSQPLPVYKG